ncbi:MAG: stage III sporulation protein AG, partial [Lachnospiraceae bacterium]
EKIIEWKSKLGKDTCIILLLSGVLLFIIAIPTKKTTNPTKELMPNTKEKEIQTMTREEDWKDEELTYTQYMEEKVAKTLSAMDGVGKTKVMITLRASKEQVIEKDIPNTRSITTESDAEGGNRNVNDRSSEEVTVYITDAEGNQIPYVIKQLEPDIEGVVVVAEGGGNAFVNASITEVLQALFGIEAHKIKVVQMNLT